MSGVLATFLVLAVELDGGLIALADRRITLGSDVCHPAVLSLGDVGAEGCAVTLEKRALPGWAQDAWWINREAMLLECSAADETIYDGMVRFDGIIDAQPIDAAGVWSFALAPPKRRVRMIPDYGIITATDWPLAADAAMGAQKPMVVGTVDRCPLLPVQVQPWTTLSAPALADTTQLEVADAAAFAASGSVVVDGVTYAYTDKSATLLLGMTITRRHAAGTLVAQAGSNVYLAAGHAVTAISDVRAGSGDDAVLIAGGTANLSAATVTFAAPPAVVAGATRYTLDEHFDAIAGGNTASNAANAIRAALNTYTQSGTPSGAVTAAAPGSIAFARPADGTRIISGTYSVQFSVAVGSQVGWARVKIGNDIVWTYDPALGVVYNWSPAVITQDADADVLPVAVEVAEGGSTDQVTVTLIAASRVAITGNIDEANFATVAPGQSLKVTQSDTPPDRGRIAGARLVVRWFATDATLGATSVAFGGAALGALALMPNSGASINKTVTVNSVTQGAAGLPQQSISTVVSGGTANLSHQSIVQQVSITAPILRDMGAGVYRGYSPVPSFDGWDVSLGNITFRMMIAGTSIADAENKYSSGVFIEYLNSAGVPVTSGITAGTTQTIVSGQMYAVVQHLNFAPASLRFMSTGYTGLTYPMQSVSVSWNGKITSGAAVVANTPAAGYSNPISAQSLANTGIAVSLTNNAIQLTVPAPPRVVDTVFALPGYTDWSHFAAKTAEISLTGTGASLCIVETYLQIEYDELAHVAAESLTATVSGLDGNPASVISLLAAASDEAVDVAASVRLSAWCAANSLIFARRLAEPTDALTLLQFAADQAGLLLARDADALRPVRWTDLADTITAITDADLLEPAHVAWADPVENHITLRYAGDYAGGTGFARVAQATAADTLSCSQSVAALAETRPVEIDGGWLRADAAAAAALAQRVARFARPRRVAALDLPFGIELEQGALIEYDTAVWRVTQAASDNGWLRVDAEEVLP